MFSANVGGLDRAVRLVVGLTLLAAGLWMRVAAASSQGTVIAVIGLLILASGLTRFCILYVPFGISTVRRARVDSR